jgi:hypothetical protein
MLIRLYPRDSPLLVNLRTSKEETRATNKERFCKTKDVSVSNAIEEEKKQCLASATSYEDLINYLERYEKLSRWRLYDNVDENNSLFRSFREKINTIEDYFLRLWAEKLDSTHGLGKILLLYMPERMTGVLVLEILQAHKQLYFDINEYHFSIIRNHYRTLNLDELVLLLSEYKKFLSILDRYKHRIVIITEMRILIEAISLVENCHTSDKLISLLVLCAEKILQQGYISGLNIKCKYSVKGQDMQDDDDNKYDYTSVDINKSLLPQGIASSFMFYLIVNEGRNRGRTMTWSFNWDYPWTITSSLSVISEKLNYHTPEFSFLNEAESKTKMRSDLHISNISNFEDIVGFEHSTELLINYGFYLTKDIHLCKAIVEKLFNE